MLSCVFINARQQKIYETQKGLVAALQPYHFLSVETVHDSAARTGLGFVNIDDFIVSTQTDSGYASLEL